MSAQCETPAGCACSRGSAMLRSVKKIAVCRIVSEYGAVRSIVYSMVSAGPVGATLIQSRFMFQGLEHTAIASPDPKRLAEWYVQNLDFHINYTYGGNYFVRASNGTVIEIIPSEGDRAPQK